MGRFSTFHISRSNKFKYDLIGINRRSQDFFENFTLGCCLIKFNVFTFDCVAELRLIVEFLDLTLLFSGWDLFSRLKQKLTGMDRLQPAVSILDLMVQPGISRGFLPV